MKKTDWKIVIATIFYTLLFYKQQAGLNFFLFSVLLVVLTWLNDTQKIKKLSWLAVSAGALFSGFFVFYYGTNLPIIANIVSLIVLAAISFNSENSFLMAGLNAVTSFIATIPGILSHLFGKKNEEDKTVGNKWLKKIALLFFPLFVVFVFFVLYRDANPLFLKITEDINLDWLSFPLVNHFLLGGLFMYAFFVQRTIKKWNEKDLALNEKIEYLDNETHNTTFVSRYLSLESETYIALAMLLMLNVLIAFLNAIDVYYLWLKNALPIGLVFSDYLRSGTFTLIVSIVLVIAIIVFFFRGVLNFNTTSKSLKILAYVWIAQNVFMIISAMQRNQMYIAQYGMTHKRIGVYIFLLLAIIGLIVALYKVIKTMNLWFIIRKSVWAFYAVLIVLSAVNWDYIITAYNIKLANKNFIIDLDKDYLAGLSHANTYMLAIQETNEVPLEFYDFNNDYNMRNDKQNEKIRALFGYDERKQWQEKCINKDKNVAILKSLNAKGKLTKLDLYANWLNEIPVYKNLDQVKGINLVNNQVGNNLNNLKYYPNVQVLNLSGNEITHLDSLPLLAELTHLNLSNNQVFDFNSLSNVPNITNLDISNQQIEIKAEKFPKLANLKSIKLNNSSIREFAFLKDLNHLEELFLEANNHRMGNIPLLPALKKLSLQQSNIFDQSPNLLIQFSKNNTLEELNLEGCNLQSTYYLLFPNTKTALFPSLKTLNLKNNNLRTNVNFLASYSQLIALDLSNNSLDETAALSALTQLKTLQLNDNVNVKLSFLKALTQLEALEIQNIGIKSLKETKEMQNLKKLNVASNNIANLNDIAIPNSITDLDLSNNNISDINALATLKNLKTLSIAQNNITDFSVLYTMTHLEELNLGEIPLEIVELLKKKLPKTRINYYSNKLNLDISYSNIRKASFDESF